MKQSSFYFTPTFLSNDCLFVLECFSNESLDIDSCNVLYTTDSMYLDSTMIVSPLNTQFEITEVTSNIIYYFDFSLSVNHTLLVRNRITEKAVSSKPLCFGTNNNIFYFRSKAQRIGHCIPCSNHSGHHSRNSVWNR